MAINTTSHTFYITFFSRLKTFTPPSKWFNTNPYQNINFILIRFCITYENILDFLENCFSQNTWWYLCLRAPPNRLDFVPTYKPLECAYPIHMA